MLLGPLGLHTGDMAEVAGQIAASPAGDSFDEVVLPTSTPRIDWLDGSCGTSTMRKMPFRRRHSAPFDIFGLSPVVMGGPGFSGSFATHAVPGAAAVSTNQPTHSMKSDTTALDQRPILKRNCYGAMLLR